MQSSLPIKRTGVSYRQRSLAMHILVTLVLASLCYCFIAPVLWLFFASTKTQEDVLASAPL
jgi:ABC-type glycerol-3-phosphate transport system permease component